MERKLLDACGQVKLDVKDVFQKETVESLKGMSSVMGVPIEFFTHPLVACTALMMNGSSVFVSAGSFIILHANIY